MSNVGLPVCTIPKNQCTTEYMYDHRTYRVKVSQTLPAFIIYLSGSRGYAEDVVTLLNGFKLK